jgi:hypothetical protein
MLLELDRRTQRRPASCRLVSTIPCGKAMPSGMRIPHTAWINTNITVHRGDPLMFCELSNSRTRLTQPIRNALSTHVKPIFFNRASVGLKLGGN